MSDQKRLESAAALVGLHGRSPQAIIRQATSSLRLLLDEGIPADAPRCRALLQLANTARLQLLPHSNDGAAEACDVITRAVHVDISTATLAASMGLQNAAQLQGTALNLAETHPPSASANAASSSNALRMRLLPKLCESAINTVVDLVREDKELGLRSKREATERENGLTSRVQRARLSSRHATTRRRRSQADATPPSTTPNHTTRLSLCTPTSASNPVTQPATPAFPFSALGAHRRNSMSFGDELATQPFANDSVFPNNLLMSHKPSAQTASDRFALGNMDTIMPRATDALTRFRPRTLQIEKRQKGVRGAVAREKGVMNDAIGTPDDVMEAFMHASHRPPQQTGNPTDSRVQVRSILAERERMVYRSIRQRKAELSALPFGVTEQTRRKSIIEAKQLSLLDLQRVVRSSVCAEMKKMFSPTVQEHNHVPADNLSRLFRRRDPPVYSYMDGYPRITPFDGIPEMPPRHPTTIAQDSIRMAEFDLSRMATHKIERKKAYVLKLQEHIENFSKSIVDRHATRGRILKGLERYFTEKKRIEERKRKMERIERLKLLRSNDEQAYLDLLKNTKNERLLQLVRQTDNYLMQIGAQVEQQRDCADRILESDAHDAFAEELGETGDVPLEAMRRRRDLYYTVTHAVQEEVEQPSIMVHGKLKGYQVEGLKWMVSLYNNNLNGILADEMGLGKTIQTISLITYLVEVKKNRGPFMIIVPLSTMGNWIRELDLWAPSLEKIEYRGDRNTRRHIHRTQLAARTFNILLTTYEFTVKDQSVLSQMPWQYIIIDEGHRMKNANCKLAMTLGVKYKSRNRLLLTGTPLQNNLTELWALLNFLLPNIFSSSDTFETWFKQPFETTTLGDTADLEEEERLLVINRLHQVLRPFLLRRLKTDVESQLPQKVEHVIRCDMSSWQRAIYRQVTNRMGLATGAHNGSVRSFNNLLMQCKKVCNHPYLFYDAEGVSQLPDDYLIRSSGKFFVLQHMLPKLRLDGHRTLIFSQMTAALDLLENFLTAIGINYLRLDGNTRADERQELLNLYNQPDSPYFCFLLSTRAGGLGLNLQTADTVIIFDSDWNPMMDLQAQDRAHRIGQTRVVRVYRLICSGTVEVKILEQANKKLHVDAQVIQAGQFNNKSTESDRHQMLKDLLRQQNDGRDGVGDVPSMEELNQLIARNEGEAESYDKYDEETAINGVFKRLLATDEELPAWVLKPDVEHKDAAELEMELLNSHGRGRRKRKATLDLNTLTEAEWVKVAEGDITVEEAFERKLNRKRARISANEKGDEETNGIDGNQSGDIGRESDSVADDESSGPAEESVDEVDDGPGPNEKHIEADGYVPENGRADGQRIHQNKVGDDVNNRVGNGGQDIGDAKVSKRKSPSKHVGTGTRMNGRVNGEGVDQSNTAGKNGSPSRARKGPNTGKDPEKHGYGGRQVWLKLRIKPEVCKGPSDQKRKSGSKKRVRIADGDAETLVERGVLKSGTKLRIRISNPAKRRRADDGGSTVREGEREKEKKLERENQKARIQVKEKEGEKCLERHRGQEQQEKRGRKRERGHEREREELKIRIPAAIGAPVAQARRMERELKRKESEAASKSKEKTGTLSFPNKDGECNGVHEASVMDVSVLETPLRHQKVEVADAVESEVERRTETVGDGVRRSSRKRRKRIVGQLDDVMETKSKHKAKGKGKARETPANGLHNDADRSGDLGIGTDDDMDIGDAGDGDMDMSRSFKSIPLKLRVRRNRR